jgi:hypothetical protein
MRWPQGFHCPRCEHTGYWMSSRGICICCRCEYHQSITAGTILHSTKKPLRAWFKAMWWFTTRKSGINAVNLKVLLGSGSYNTAWRWLQKLRSCTIRKGREKLSGHVEEKYLAWYLDEYVFRFNRRTTKSVGKRFWRFVQQLAVSKPITNIQVATAVISPLLAN